MLLGQNNGNVANDCYSLYWIGVLDAIGVDLAGILRGTHGEYRRWVGAEWGRGMVRGVPSPAD